MRTPLRVAAVAALVLALAGCTGPLGGSSGSDGGGVSGPGVVAPEQPATGEDSDRGESRQEIITGTLSMVAADPLESADRARDLVEGAGGRLDGFVKEPKSQYQEASAQLIARIPSDRLDETIEELEGLATVQSLSTSSADVTRQKTDLDSRIRSLQASTDRLRQLITTAATTADLIAIETALSDREAQLESLIAERDYLADQIEYATLTIIITTPANAPTPAPTDFWSAVVAGFTALVAALSWTVIAFGAALPWLAFLALLALAVIGIIRLLRSRLRGRRPATPATAEGPPPEA
ncbi:DUF4349 domain-containing protein [Naasia sp. SYSU D00948]|uniref:DUF4349 domain-containing protein n=1 Tax=Naasia sp. SYSU D00948 TaxID=2817379 RepID=UPI001B3142FA|nr:DUF4349 domain-containing protein [Naasia sp. SYSU D00948]